MSLDLERCIRYNRSMNSDISGLLRSLISWAATILLTLAVIFVGEFLPFMPAVKRYQEGHPAINQALIVRTLVMTVVGILLLALTQFLVRVPARHGAQSRAQTIKTK